MDISSLITITGTRITTFDSLRIRFNTSCVSVEQLSTITLEREQSIRNALSKGKYPIPSFKAGGKRLFLLADVAAFIDKCLAESAIEAERRIHSQSQKGTGQIKRRRGRPKKAEQLARERLQEGSGS